MESIPSFNSYIEQSIIKNWDQDALTDYKGATLQYKDVARKIEKVHILFENCGVKPGDKIALCGRNCAHWAVSFLAVLSYGAVVVPILHEFNAEQIHNIVNHSESKLLFVFLTCGFQNRIADLCTGASERDVRTEVPEVLQERACALL